jgi:hypothetical protein
MIRRVSCFVVECDECRSGYNDNGEGCIYYFDSDRRALDHVAADGWTISHDGHLCCPVCTARSFCASLDHLWDLWRICECRGAIPAHADNGCGLYRRCAQCGAIELADLAHLPTTGQHDRRGR